MIGICLQCRRGYIARGLDRHKASHAAKGETCTVVFPSGAWSYSADASPVR